MTTFLHSFGLVDGNIPAGIGCPFANECGMRQAHCPTAERPREVPFSCGAARLHSMVRLASERKREVTP